MHKEATHAKKIVQKSIVCWPILLQEAMSEQVMLVRNKLAVNQLS